ncbi:UNKNOWN [Stylonychia lemnae]|uniref:Uncharacterized protein n=1 Tax=Stylonychia lemnae TaxID=5949 RepID=A0A078AC03_STYLE|nr:UNKNOWN [Stylonychia lemnae]|eukprot:CDW79132.1 UNKNOWN [Stylonychia lemnae]
MNAFGGAQKVQVRQFANSGQNSPRPNQPKQFQQQQQQPTPFQQQNQFPQQQQQQTEQNFKGGYQGKPNNFRQRGGRGGYDSGGSGGYDGNERGRGRGRDFQGNQQNNFGSFQNKGSYISRANQQEQDEMIDDSTNQIQPQAFQQINSSGFGNTNNFNQPQQQNKSQFYGQQKGVQNQSYGQQNQFSNYKGQNQQFKGNQGGQNLDMGMRMDQDDSNQKQVIGGYFGAQKQVTQSLSTNQTINSGGGFSGQTGFPMQNNTYDQKSSTQSFGQNQSMTSTMQSTQPGQKQEPFINTDPNKVLYFTEQQLSQFSNTQCRKAIMKENAKGPMDEFGFFSLAFNYYYNPQLPNQDPNLDYLPSPQDV